MNPDGRLDPPSQSLFKNLTAKQDWLVSPKLSSKILTMTTVMIGWDGGMSVSHARHCGVKSRPCHRLKQPGTMGTLENKQHAKARAAASTQVTTSGAYRSNIL